MKPPRHWVPDALYDVSERALSMAARTVYGALCRCVTKGEAKPSVARLARMVAAHRTTVMDALAELEKAGMVATRRQFGAANRYGLTEVEQWKVPMTGRSQRPVEAPSCTETSRPESQNQSVRTAEPVSQGDTLGSTAGRTAGSEAVSNAPDLGMPAWKERRAIEDRLWEAHPKWSADRVSREAHRELVQHPGEPREMHALPSGQTAELMA